MRPTNPGRYLVIVARGRDDLHAYLRGLFAESPYVGVIVDRRQSSADARPSDRRANRVEDQLRLFGWAMVTAAD